MSDVKGSDVKGEALSNPLGLIDEYWPMPGDEFLPVPDLRGTGRS